MRLHVSRSAQKDIDKSYAYYYEINVLLAGRFIKAIDKAFQHILDYPDAYPLRYKNFRGFVMLHFPFLILYKVEDDMIIVEAVFHARRNPIQYPG